MNFKAAIDNIGDWDGAEEIAISEWNRLVAPALEKLEKRAEFYGEDVEAECKAAQQAAFERFCQGGEEISQAAEAAKNLVWEW